MDWPIITEPIGYFALLPFFFSNGAFALAYFTFYFLPTELGLINRESSTLAGCTFFKHLSIPYIQFLQYV